MRLRPQWLVVGVLLTALFPLSSAALASQLSDEGPGSTAIERWLILGPVSHPLPAFDDAEKGGFDLGKLLEEENLPVSVVSLKNGTKVNWFSDEPLVWTATQTPDSGALTLRAPDGVGEGIPATAWLATYISTKRWQSLELELTGGHPRKAWLDGAAIVKGGLPGDADSNAKETVKLVPGKHLLVVQTIFDASREADWNVGATLSSKNGVPEITSSLDEERNVELRDIIDAPRISSLALSPDGKHVATTVSRIVPGTDDRESWIEIHQMSDGTLSDSRRGGDLPRQIAWSPDGRYVSYVADAPGESTNGKPSTLFLLDRERHSTVPLLEGVDRLAGYRWSPTSRAVVYWTTVKGKEFKDGVKRVEGLMDRWSTHRDKDFLHLATVPGGVRRQLTAGRLTTSATGFSPDGARLLFTREVEHLSERPYSKTELWEMDLRSIRASKLRDFAWLGDASYSPDGKTLLISTHAEAFGSDGVDVPEGSIPNSYDIQLFVWHPSTDEVEALTRQFNPAVSNAVWSRADGHIYVTAQDRDYQRLYRYDVNQKTFTPLDTGFDVFSSFDVARDASVGVGLGQSPWVPQSLVAVDLAGSTAKGLSHPADQWFASVGSGSIESWGVELSSGERLDGRVYLPPGFDAQKKYPMIVYYYGGTSPVDRTFGGRYPKEWWAASGYVVYVLQPSGATGFGQAFSARHVNDWGKTSSQEIIEGTKKFLDAHPYVDPGRVGCIGASYGGFMTMLLTTSTDVFSAAVAHAGISSLSSYWGEGYWGYSYSSVATANSFPWNRKDVYVDQSPLFRADQARFPILLTHGTVDTNVPVGESDAFFVALKLLGKQVEYVQVEGENHHILTHDKRVVWSRTIVAWFDRWLKDEPQWWNDLYPGSDGQ